MARPFEVREDEISDEETEEIEIAVPDIPLEILLFKKFDDFIVSKGIHVIGAEAKSRIRELTKNISRIPLSKGILTTDAFTNVKLTLMNAKIGELTDEYLQNLCDLLGQLSEEDFWKIYTFSSKTEDRFYSFLFCGINRLNQNEIDDSLLYAIRKGFVEVLRFLIDKGANYQMGGFIENFPLHEAIRYENREIISILVNLMGGFQNQTYHINRLIAEGRNDFVEFLIEAGAEVEWRDNDFLITAIKTHNYEMVKFLLDHGANVDARDGEPYKLATSGYFNLRIANLLMDYGAGGTTGSVVRLAKSSYRAASDFFKKFSS